MRLPGRCLMIVWMFGLLVGCGYLGGTEDYADRVASEFGVPRDDVLEMAELLNVDTDKLASFGLGFFPYNFYRRKLESFEQEYGRPPTRSDVEAMVQGYIAKCEIGTSGIAYVYYSDRVHPSWISRELAMVFRVAFELPAPGEPKPEDPVFSRIIPINLRDGSVNPSSETFWEECIREYLHRP